MCRYFIFVTLVFCVLSCSRAKKVEENSNVAIDTVQTVTAVESTQDTTSEEDRLNVCYRDANESADSFCIRAVSNYTEGYVESNIDTPLSFKWNQHPVVLGFFDDQSDESTENRAVQGYVLINFDSTSNQHMIYTTNMTEWVAYQPTIKTVFCANADNDPEKELLFLLEFSAPRYADITASYEIQVYDFPTENGEVALRYLADISKKLDPGVLAHEETGNTDSDGFPILRVSSKPKFETASDIKKALLAMGYK